LLVVIESEGLNKNELKYEVTLRNIAEVLKNHSSSLENSRIGLAEGLSGYSLTLFEIGNELNDDALNDSALTLISRAIEGAESENLKFSHINGLSGLAWTLCYFAEKKVIELDEEFFEGIESVLSEVAMNHLNQGDYDLLHGGLGIGLFFLKRNNDYSREIVSNMISALESFSVNDVHGRRWFNLRGKFPKSVDLGLAHGLPGIMSFLLRAHDKGIRSEDCRRIILEILDYLLSHRYLEEGKLSFPSAVSEENGIVPVSSSRLAWCYGDLSISIVLLQIAKSLRLDDLKDQAIEIGLNTTKFKDPNVTFLSDAAFCHGFGGVSYLYNKLFLLTGLRTFEENSKFWLVKAITLVESMGGVSNFRSFIPEKNDLPGKETGWVQSFGLLEGLAGMAMALCEKSNENGWDECLLLS